MQRYEAVSTVETENKKGWVDYGIDNLYPQYLIDLYYSAPIHNALTNSIIEMIAGKGLYGDAAGETLLKQWKINKQNRSIASDLKMQGGYWLEVILSMDKKSVARVNHLPFENCRIAYSEEREEITGVYYSRDWNDTRKKRNTPEYIPLFEAMPDASNENAVVKYCTYTFRQTVGSSYYPKPDYIGSLNWIELQRQIAIYHVNNIMNGFFPSIIAQFNNGQPDPEKATQIVRDFERKMSGAVNAGKLIALFNDNKDAAATFETFPLTDADKQYALLSEESRENTLIAHRVTTPLLFGVRDGGGLGSNTDEMKAGLEIFTEKVIKPYQQMIVESLEYIAQIAGVPAMFTFEERTEDGGVDVPTEAADKSYNGAQIVSAIAILENVKTGVLTQEQAIVFLVQFLNLPQEVAQSFFNNTQGSPQSLLVKHFLKAAKKKKTSCACKLSKNDFNDEKAIEYLNGVAEEIDFEEWEEYDADIEAQACSTIEEENEYLRKLSEKVTSMAANVGSYVNPDARSEWGDTGLYKVRYAYSENISADSREFCKQMVALAQAGKVFRYEDIIAMGDEGVNGSFAPQGESTYNIFEWKGGAFCHHYFKRKIYFRKRQGGKFLPNDGLKNDQLVGNNPFVVQKGFEGIAPINTPTRGSLKYG
jgi:hypothetical protein